MDKPCCILKVQQQCDEHPVSNQNAKRCNLTFNGNPQQIVVYQSNAIKLIGRNNSDFSITFWLQFSEHCDLTDILYRGNTKDLQLSVGFLMNDVAKFHAYIRTELGTEGMQIEIKNPNELNHYSIVKQHKYLQILVNGILLKTVELQKESLGFDYPFQIGGNQFQYAKCIINDIMIFNSAINVDTIQHIMKQFQNQQQIYLQSLQNKLSSSIQSQEAKKCKPSVLVNEQFHQNEKQHVNDQNQPNRPQITFKSPLDGQNNTLQQLEQLLKVKESMQINMNAIQDKMVAADKRQYIIAEKLQLIQMLIQNKAM